MPKLKKKEQAASADAGREITYPEIVANVCSGGTAITGEDAQELLGWEGVAEGGGGYVREIYSLSKLRVRCNNNITNRPIYANVVMSLKQEILRKKWLLNGEPIIVGRTGLLLNGQHTLIALVLACREWAADKERWAEYWPEAPCIEKIVVSGVNENDATVNTMDTCKPRTLADVIYRSDYFSTLVPGERRAAARMMDHAIRLLWFRTGARLDAFAPRMTHAESLDFIARHPKLLDAVKHVHEEDGEGKIKRYLSPGYAAGLLYLMGCSSTDPTAYRGSAHPDESTLDWSRWNDACDFVVLLAAGGKQTSAIRTVMARSLEEGGLSNAERWAIISLAWLAHSEGEPITEESLVLQYTETDEGSKRLADHPSVGGIDLGDPSTVDETVTLLPQKVQAKSPTKKDRQKVEIGNLLDEEEIVDDDPEPDEILRKATEVKAKSLKRSRGSELTPAKPKVVKLGQPRKAGPNWAKDDVAWVRDTDGEHYLGQLTEDPWDCDSGDSQASVRDAKGDEWQVAYSDLSLERPIDKAKAPAVAKFSKAKQGKPSTSTSTGYKVGDRLWAYDAGGNHWRGKVVELSKNGAKLKVDQGFEGCRTIRMVWTKDLLRDQPTGNEAAA